MISPHARAAQVLKPDAPAKVSDTKVSGNSPSLALQASGFSRVIDVPEKVAATNSQQISSISFITVNGYFREAPSCLGGSESSAFLICLNTELERLLSKSADSSNKCRSVVSTMISRQRPPSYESHLHRSTNS